MELPLWLILSVLTVIPLLKLLPHFGVNKYWALAAVVPVGTVVLIWVMATKLQELERL